ncbi:hypothetical protein ACHAWO_012780 [Cyclotella atomus]|uniref:Uncharacterized protein n=1 Tax=Cyclotella atomus TaxID=382360 RepID=A0ABD3NNP0_9STRA
MDHLVSLDDDKLAHISDDAIDLCRFILKLLKSSHLTSRQAGLEALNNVLQNISKHRPPPRLYIVKGQTNQELNGVYEIDPGMTLAGALSKDDEDAVYIKKPSNEVQDSRHPGKRRRYQADFFLWHLSPPLEISALQHRHSRS